MTRQGFGTGSNSYGQFWYGGSIGFPGFLYKKNLATNGKRSTLFNAGGNLITNRYTNLNNTYQPGGSGIGASSISNRRAKNRLSTVCGPNHKCSDFYQYLGQYNNSYNQNGFFSYPPLPKVYLVPSGNYTISNNSQYNLIITLTGSGGSITVVNGPVTAYFEFYENDILLSNGTNTTGNGVYPIPLNPNSNQKLVLYFNLPVDKYNY